MYGQTRIAHKDPFDRAIVTQSLATNTPLITADQALLQLDIPNLVIIQA
jgi:PIN domain nuclease of toxin-antitoxin system